MKVIRRWVGPAIAAATLCARSAFAAPGDTGTTEWHSVAEVWANSSADSGEVRLDAWEATSCSRDGRFTIASEANKTFSVALAALLADREVRIEWECTPGGYPRITRLRMR